MTILAPWPTSRYAPEPSSANDSPPPATVGMRSESTTVMPRLRLRITTSTSPNRWILAWGKRRSADMFRVLRARSCRMMTAPIPSRARFSGVG